MPHACPSAKPSVCDCVGLLGIRDVFSCRWVWKTIAASFSSIIHGDSCPTFDSRKCNIHDEDGYQRTSQGEKIIKQTSSAEAVTRIPRRGTSRKPWLQSPAPSISIFKETESSTASSFNACLDSHHFGVASYLILAMSRREVRVLCPSQPRTGKVSCQHTIQS